MIADLRSDTVTKPTPGMLEAMFSAKVGDDVYGEDSTVHALEEKAAAIFGMEAGLFCPSGTMTNQIAIKLLTQPGDEVICDQTAHIYNYEGGGIAFLSGCSVRLLQGDRGRITRSQILENINEENIHFPRTKLVALENTVNKAGGSYYSMAHIESLSDVSRENGLSLHLDGARVFNAITATAEDPVLYGKHFDTISVCLSKGLGAPVGSLLLASKENIKKARRIRKVLGGGWRQAGYLAAAGLFALNNHVERLHEDHARAYQLWKTATKLSYIDEVCPQETNILIFKLGRKVKPLDFLQFMDGRGVKCSGFGGQQIRMVTHLDFTDEMLEQTIAAMQAYSPAI